MDYEISEKYKNLSEAVIDAIPDLHWIKDVGVRITYERSFEEKKRAGKIILGECRKVPESWQLYCPYDFRIIVYENNISDLSENQIKVLLWHELLHVGINEKNRELTYVVNPHDVEDFHHIINRFGTSWTQPGADIPNITRGGG